MGKQRLFGTDGVRGMANTDPMTAEMSLQLGQAVAHVLQSKGGERRPNQIPSAANNVATSKP